MSGRAATDLIDPAWAGQAGALAADLRRVSERWRTLSHAQLAAAPTPGDRDYPTRADAGRAAAAALADAAGALETAAGGAPLPPPGLPTLCDFAVGDQVAVTGHDLLAALALVGPDAAVPTPDGGQARAADVVGAATAVLTDVRRRI